MGVTIISGNIFTSRCSTIVNTVNCVGIMGAGIALECRLRYPVMYEKYVEICAKNELSIGKLWLYKADDRWVLNFPTKKHWKFPSKKEYLHAGLRKFVDTYQDRGITSIAFPLLGTDKGGMDQTESLCIMESYLCQLTIDIEIYRYDNQAPDDLYRKVRDWLLCQDVSIISRATRLREDYVCKVIEAVKRPEIMQLNQLGRVRGIGIKTLEKIFAAAKQSIKPLEIQTDKAMQLTLNIVEQENTPDARFSRR